MASETPFRIALVIVIVFTMAVTLYHRMQAASSGEQISRKDEGYLFAAVLRLSAFGLWIVTLAYLLKPSSIQWASIPMPISIRWFGVANGIISTLLIGWTLNSLGKNLTDTVITRVDATLVTQGPYRWVRHPYYVTTALLMTSVVLLTANWLIGLGCFAVLSLLAVRTPKEEQRLIDKFGQKYRDYMETTGRFFPRFSDRK